MGYVYKIDDSCIYNIKKYNNMILKKFAKTKIEKNLNNLNKEKIKLLFNEEKMIKYLYTLLIKKDYVKIKSLCMIYKNEFEMAIYIKTIKGE